jgi:acyl-CoA thioesterase
MDEASDESAGGAEHARRIVREMIDGDAFSRWLGIDVEHIEPGAAIVSMVVRPEMVNGFNICHGGVTFSLADSALAFASNGRGRLAALLAASMSYPVAALPGDRLTARAQEVTLTNRTGIYDVTVTKHDGTVVGVFKGTVYRTSRGYGADGKLETAGE